VEGVEVLTGDVSTPGEAAAMLSAMTLTPGRRFVIVDGAERFKDSELDPLEQALATMPSDTTVAFFAREDGRYKVTDRLRAAVTTAGGDVRAEVGVKAWDLPAWAQERAGEIGLDLDRAGARALVGIVGERQQRLLRELEKIELELGRGAHVGAEEVQELAASSSERRVWDLGDAMVAGDGAAATRIYLELTSQGERIGGLLFRMAGRLREAEQVAGRIEAGESVAQVRRGLRMPPKAAERFVADVGRTDRTALRRALEIVADLELESRGASQLEDDTDAVRAILAIAG
jgi:DNA polymerase-3 subunit delta